MSTEEPAFPAEPRRGPARSCCGGGAAPAAFRRPLSRDRIVETALAFVDANCLDDLSMRRLGAELGVEAMSLYRYFPSKAALLDAVVCRALADLELPSHGSGWETGCRAYARSFRKVARHHPHLFPLLATVGPTNDTIVAVTDRMVVLWSEAGLDRRTAVQAQSCLQGFVTGSILWDVALPEPDFEFGLDVFVDGLRPRFGSSESDARA